MKKYTLEFQIISAKINIKKYNNNNFQIYFKKRSKINNTIEYLYSQIIKITNNNIINFDKEKIIFNNIDLNNNIIEISFNIILINEIKEIKNHFIIINNLIINEQKEEIFNLDKNTNLKLIYFLKPNLNFNNISNKIPKPIRNNHFKEKSKSNKILKHKESKSIGSFNEINNEINNENKKTNNSENKSKTPGKIRGFFSLFHNSSAKNIKNTLNKSKEKILNLFDRNSNRFNSNKIEKSESNKLSIINSNNNNNKSIKVNKIPFPIKNLKRNNLFSPQISSNTNKNLLNLNNSYETIQLSNNNNNKIPLNNLIECICISGLNKNSSNFIENSNLFPSICSHYECSILYSLSPSILSYIKKPSLNLEISNLISNMIFPHGIKLCYSVIFDNNNLNSIKNKPSIYNPFMNVISNEFGENFYVISYYYYRKISNENFNKFFPNKNSLKEFLKLNSEINNKDNNQISKHFEIISELILNKTILIPECISIITKFPLLNQLEICLKNLLSISNEKTNKILNHLYNEILIPNSNNQIIYFYLPRSIKPIILNKKTFYLNFYNNNIFLYLNINNIIKIFYAILLEQRILFISNNYQILSKISFFFTNLIFPIVWVNTYVPIMNYNNIQFLQSFMPFIMGIDEYLYNQSVEKNYINFNNENEINIVVIDKNIKIKSKFNNKVSDIPNRLYDFLLIISFKCDWEHLFFIFFNNFINNIIIIIIEIIIFFFK